MTQKRNRDKSNVELLGLLGVEAKPKKQANRTPQEERIIAGFEEIQRFVGENRRLPQHGENNDIFERLYAVRLDQIRKQEGCNKLLADNDRQGLLSGNTKIAETPATYESDEELLAQLGVNAKSDSDITKLKHVKPRAEIRAAEEVAQRLPCPDFDQFKSLFKRVQKELSSGLREAKLLQKSPNISEGDWFILGGQKLLVASVGKEFINDYGRKDSRLRVIYDNETESALLIRSLQKALKMDEAGRRIVHTSAGPLFDTPLFADIKEDNDQASGTVYVLRSKSNHPLISEHRKIVHKIGVTGGSIEKRVSNAALDPTFLMAEVEVVASYELFNINRSKLENLIHKFFEPAKLDIEIPDRFGNKVAPKEWFLVPLNVIDEVVELIRNGSIDRFYYDIELAILVRHED